MPRVALQARLRFAGPQVTTSGSEGTGEGGETRTSLGLKETSEAIRLGAVASMEKTRGGLAAAGLKFKQSTTVG